MAAYVNPYAQFYALEYRNYTAPGTTFTKTLMRVREPNKTWRDALKGATYATASDWLVKHGWMVEGRSHDHRGGVKVTVELWKKREDALAPL
jgi:hypothetical protein